MEGSFIEDSPHAKNFGSQGKGKTVAKKIRFYPYSRPVKERPFHFSSNFRSYTRDRCFKCGKAHDVLLCPNTASVCFNCGKLGHFYKDCTQNRNVPWSHVFKAEGERKKITSEGQPSTKKSRYYRCRKDHDVAVCPEESAVCYNCGKPGHFMKDCICGKNVLPLRTSGVDQGKNKDNRNEGRN